jgi:hypothetical protein
MCLRRRSRARSAGGTVKSPGVAWAEVTWPAARPRLGQAHLERTQRGMIDAT